MLLNDREIKALIDNGTLRNADPNRVGPVSYDLTTSYFALRQDEYHHEWDLNPGDSVFVATAETVQLPSDICARVLLKNSRIRQGLSLDAPLYFPGHGTRVFFRVTNVSGNRISLNTGNGIAQITFERLDGPVEHPYGGAFTDEMDFSGMGSYTDIYAAETHELQKKAEELRGIERRMYGNVMAIMAIFAAIFTLVNVNMGAASAGLASVVIMNLATVGSFAILVALIAHIMQTGKKGTARLPLVIGVVCFLAVLAIGCLLSLGAVWL